jgi:K+-sensing histidine kinase KdpD
LLDVARVTTGKIALHRQPLDLAQVTRRAVTVMRDSSRLGRHQVDVSAGEVWVMGDEVRLEQIVINLVDNAAKYTPDGGRITVRVAKDGDDAVLEVVDTGMGIAADLLPRIFDLFIQGERTLDRAQADWGSGFRSCGGWWSCTAAAFRRTAPGSAMAHSSSCVCLPLPQVPGPAPLRLRRSPCARARFSSSKTTPMDVKR